MIAIVDCGMGNPGSILNMIRRVGGSAELTAEVERIAGAKGLVLPGAGSFDHGMERLGASGLCGLLEERVLGAGVPLLGICLGMQLLFEGSAEGTRKGLGWVSGFVQRFNFESEGEAVRGALRIPHMGWNTLETKGPNPLLGAPGEGARFYFVHSYHAVCSDERNVTATARYGYDFAAAVQAGSVFGVQFHPEKSHRFGMDLFRNFLEICR